MAYARRDIRGGAVQTTLTAGITSGAASCAIASSTGWPDGSVGGFYVVIDPGLSTEEKVLCSTRSSLTVNFTTRGADGSTASAHGSGAVIYPIISAVDIDEANYTTSQTVGKVTSTSDLLVGSGANALARLAKGSNSTVLGVDSGGSLGYSTVTNAQLAGSIAYSKLVLTGSVTNADLAGSIAYSKLALSNSIVSGDIVDGTIVNADINAAAAIAYSKLALSGSITSSDITDGTIVNGDINAGAAIAVSKTALAAGTGLSLSTNTLSLDSSFVTTGAWTSYTPTVTQPGSLAKTVTYAKYHVVGKLVHVNVQLTITGTGTAGTNLAVSLPFTSAASTAGQIFGAGNISHSGSTYPVHVLIDTTGGVKFLQSATNAAAGYWGVDPNAGVVNGDQITFMIAYEAA